MNIVGFISLFALCLTTSGCFPYHYTTRPGLSGKVVSAGSDAPLIGAGVFLGTNITAIALSTSDGSFYVPPERQWGIWIIPQDVFMRGCPISIRLVGYEAYATVVGFNPGDLGKDATKQIGDISLIPVEP